MADLTVGGARVLPWWKVRVEPGDRPKERAGICGDSHGAERPMDQDDIDGPEAQGVAAGSRNHDGGNDGGREDDREAVETQLKTWKYAQEAERRLIEARGTREPRGVLELTDHNGVKGVQSWVGANGLTGQGGVMGLDDRVEIGESASSCQAGDREARGRAGELDGACIEGGIEELDCTGVGDLLGPAGKMGTTEETNRDLDPQTTNLSGCNPLSALGWIG